MNKSCRVCLLNKEGTKFISLNNEIFTGITILQTIVDCAAIEILKIDPFPEVVCISCLKKLQSYYRLRQLIIKSDVTLKSLVQAQTKDAPLKHEILQNKEQRNANMKNDDDSKNCRESNSMIVTMDVKAEITDFNYSSDCDDNTETIRPDDLKQPDNQVKKTKKRLAKKLNKTHKCQECNKVFKKADHYTIHMTKHTGEKKYACEFCPKRFARSYVLVYHRRVHTGERPYSCDICSKSFSSPSNFYTHKKIHTGQRNYKCDLCNESFIQSDSLKIHIRRIHTGERPFLCEICSSAFRSNSSLLTHKLDMHGKKEACPICDKLYSSRVLKEHVRRHKEREQGIKRFICDQCGKSFTCSSSRKKHLLIHSGERPYSCEICEKSFNQRSALKTHMRVHSDFMAFSCEYCPKSFRYKHHLRSHINTHHKEMLEVAISNDQN